MADLSLTTLLTAMRDVGCGDPHPVLAGGLRYVPPSAKTRVDRVAFEELSEYGFTQGDGFTPEFEDVLQRIDNPKFYAYARDETGQIGVLATTGVTVVCRGDRVTLESHDAHPADALVANLPPYRPAKIKPFTLSQEDFKGPQIVSDVFDDAPARSREAQELDAFFQQAHQGLGQLYGDDHTVSYLDLDEGRVGIALQNGYISVVPGEKAQLSQKLKAATPQ
ncbi:EspG family protein [Amycolatopsis pretoriensis]|uniref:EspG family protein n=1 Tax=Amycolatopsis pretoriensis TaxID=218821 RepID=A0A1H5R0K7_9PSEU|nr:ESX secretion-associated protein EspG [Amycolatopsis pretoriensis]SEF31111.1 EspG family protein [Amycolatopsis pretoriensis]